MSLRLDSRAGSAELHEPLASAGLSPELCIMPAGDIEIMGHGPGGRPLLIGVEYKSIRDVLTCVRDGRFAEQSRKMAAYFEVRWLLIEGEWRTEHGLLEVRERAGFRERGHHTYQEVVAWTLTMAQRGGVLLWRTRDRAESVAWLRAMYWWWTSKDYEEHRAHLDWYQPLPTGESPFEEAGLVQRVAAILPGIGSGRALAAAGAFGSIRQMAIASAAEWQRVEGIGPKTARRVVEAMG